MVAVFSQTWYKNLDPGRFLEVTGLSDIRLKLSFEAMKND